MLQQAQLLNVALDPQDVVYTPDWVAADMVVFGLFTLAVVNAG